MAKLFVSAAGLEVCVRVLVGGGWDDGQEIRSLVCALSESLYATAGGAPDHRTRLKAVEVALRLMGAWEKWRGE